MIRLLAPALLIPLTVVAPTMPSQAAPPPVSARKAAVLTTYDCDSDYGGGSGVVRIATKLPESVRAAKPVRPRVVRVLLTVPEELVDQLRAFGVDSLKGSSSSAKLKIGTKSVKVRGLKIPRTDVPDEGSMRLRGAGTADGFTIRRAGEYDVLAPKRLSAQITAQANGFSGDADLTCAVAPGAPRRLTTLLVRN